MHILSGRWRLIIAHCLLNGPKRFSDLQRDIPGISRRMLAFDLKKLEESKVISRTVYAEVPARVEYRLTSDGLELRSIISDLHSWAQRIKDRTKELEKEPPIPSPTE